MKLENDCPSFMTSNHQRLGDLFLNYNFHYFSAIIIELIRIREATFSRATPRSPLE